MVESPEGIGSRKWSIGRDSDGYPALMQGAHVIARLTEPDPTRPTGASGMELLHLLVTAPQLWDAANQLFVKLAAIKPGCAADLQADYQYLQNMVAKAVNKDDWAKVLQA
jgi:hypothetical protein